MGKRVRVPGPSMGTSLHKRTMRTSGLVAVVSHAERFVRGKFFVAAVVPIHKEKIGALHLFAEMCNEYSPVLINRRHGGVCLRLIRTFPDIGPREATRIRECVRQMREWVEERFGMDTIPSVLPDFGGAALWLRVPRLRGH